MKRTFITVIVLNFSFLMLAQNSGDLENQFYFRFGYSHPTAAYFGIDEEEAWDFIKVRGGIYEIGQIFMLNKIPLSDGLRIGINADYTEFSYHQLAFTDFDETLGLAKVSSKLGPSISYSPTNKLVFDAFAKVKISWMAALAKFSEDIDVNSLGFFGVGASVGINVRYSYILFGFEYNTDKIKLEDVDNPGEYLGTLTWPPEDTEITPMPTFSFTLGFSF